jgi:hypothetical protein
MGKKSVKKNLMCLWLLTLCNLASFAQIGKPVKRIVPPTEMSEIRVPPPEIPAGLKTIYSNLGKKTDLYTGAYWLVSGPNSGFNQFIAMPFTTKSDSHVSQVDVAVLYAGKGANQVNLSIYADSGGGYPGTLLAGPVTVTDLADEDSCCTLAVASFSAVAVTAGVQYWVTATTPLTGTGSDFFGGWNFTGKASLELGLDFDDDGWFATGSDELPAGEVLGTIP